MTIEGPLYPNQPLLEVATEVRFQGDYRVDQVRAEFQALVKDNFPLLRVPQALQGVAPALQPTRFVARDGASGIQLAINSIGFFATDYPGHDKFFSQSFDAVGQLLGLLQYICVTRIGWRYINAIPYVREDEMIPAHRFIKENDVFGNVMSLPLCNMAYRTQQKIDDTYLNAVAHSATNQEGSEAIILDIDSYQEFEDGLTMEQNSIEPVIVTLHDLAYGVFESVITDQYREFLRGNQND